MVAAIRIHRDEDAAKGEDHQQRAEPAKEEVGAGGMIKPRNRGKGRPQVACIACLYSCGFGAKRIGAIVHYSPAAVTKAMHRHGLPTLSAAQRHAINVRSGSRRSGPFTKKSLDQFNRNIAKAIQESRMVFCREIDDEKRAKAARDYVNAYRTSPEFMIKARLRRRLRPR